MWCGTLIRMKSRETHEGSIPKGMRLFRDVLVLRRWARDGRDEHISTEALQDIALEGVYCHAFTGLWRGNVMSVCIGASGVDFSGLVCLRAMVCLRH